MRKQQKNLGDYFFATPGTSLVTWTYWT